MMANSGIVIDLSGLKIDQLISKSNLEKANLALSNRVAETTEKFVPEDHGDLRGSVKIDVDSVSWTTDYANRVYNMDDVSTNWTTPKDGGDPHSHWIEPSKEANMDDWEQLASDAILGAL